jgi:hypothetical protein
MDSQAGSESNLPEIKSSSFSIVEASDDESDPPDPPKIAQAANPSNYSGQFIEPQASG